MHSYFRALAISIATTENASWIVEHEVLLILLHNVLLVFLGRRQKHSHFVANAVLIFGCRRRLRDWFVNGLQSEEL